MSVYNALVMIVVGVFGCFGSPFAGLFVGFVAFDLGLSQAAATVLGVVAGVSGMVLGLWLLSQPFTTGTKPT
jgi:hypothetical protein